MPVVQEARLGLHAASTAPQRNPAFRPEWRTLALAAVDATAILVAGIVSAFACAFVSGDHSISVGTGLRLALPAAVSFVALAHACDLYATTRLEPASDATKSTCIVWTFVSIVLVLMTFLPGFLSGSAALILGLFTAGLLILTAIRHVLRRISVRSASAAVPDDYQVVVVTQDNRSAPLTPPQATAKRLLDLLAGTFAFVLVLPALLMIAALIRLDSPGPVLFRQRRTGLNGRSFHIFKFRTMKTLDDGPVVRQASRDDNRITRVGHILRRLSLDELPQLFNVLRGDMSLVGPRPHALAHDLQYGQAIDFYAARHDVKPGITGWAQVNGWRGPTPQLELMIRRLEHDLWYIDNWSLWLDVKILFMTIRCVHSGQNAF